MTKSSRENSDTVKWRETMASALAEGMALTGATLPELAASSKVPALRSNWHRVMRGDPILAKTLFISASRHFRAGVARPEDPELSRQVSDMLQLLEKLELKGRNFL